MTSHVFDIEVAKEVGLNAAVILSNIKFWCDYNKANNKNLHDEKYWVYNSVKSWAELLPYLTARQVRTALDKLIDDGFIFKGEFNKAKYDKTSWFAYNYSRQIHLSEKSNGSDQNDKPIPIVNSVSKPLKDNGSSNEQPPVDNSKNLSISKQGFEYIWEVWKDEKKAIGKKDTSAKTHTFEKNWKKLFNTKYFNSHTTSEFEKEIADIGKSIIIEHSITDFNPTQNMQLARFLTLKKWRDDGYFDDKEV